MTQLGHFPISYIESFAKEADKKTCAKKCFNDFVFYGY